MGHGRSELLLWTSRTWRMCSLIRGEESKSPSIAGMTCSTHVCCSTGPFLMRHLEWEFMSTTSFDVAPYQDPLTNGNPPSIPKVYVAAGKTLCFFLVRGLTGTPLLKRGFWRSLSKLSKSKPGCSPLPQHLWPPICSPSSARLWRPQGRHRPGR